MSNHVKTTLSHMIYCGSPIKPCPMKPSAYSCTVTVSLVNDLLEYCEETEDSSENSETQEMAEN